MDNKTLRERRLLLQSVIAHELGHLKCDHGVWLSLANIFANGTASVLPVISSAVEESVLRSCTPPYHAARNRLGMAEVPLGAVEDMSSLQIGVMSLG